MLNNSPTTPTLQPKRATPTISSYLVSVPDKKSEPIDVLKQKQKQKQKANKVTPDQHRQKKAKTKPAPSDLASVIPKKMQSDPITSNYAVNKEPISNTINTPLEAVPSPVKLSTILTATSHYLQRQDLTKAEAIVSPYTMQTKEPLRPIKNKDPSTTYSYTHPKSGIELVAIDADGTKIVKMGSGCLAIVQDQWRDSVWLHTPCPNSTDETRALLNASFKKYGLD